MRVMARTLPKNPAARYRRTTKADLVAEFRCFLQSASNEEKRFLMEAFLRRGTASHSDIPMAAATVSLIMGDDLLVIEGWQFRRLEKRCAELEKLVAKIVPIDKPRAA
jgi:hypothetical protein